MHKSVFGYLALALVTSCAPAGQPLSVAFTARPEADSVAISAAVSGGPEELWVGFGVGPGATPELVEKVSAVRAFDANGDEIAVAPAGYGGFHVRTGGGRWQLTYELEVSPGNSDAFYRSSAGTDEYVVLVGSDAWPRFYADPSPLAVPPEARPAGSIAHAVARFELPGDDWRVVTTAWEEAPGTFAMRRHPIASVFALGPFETTRLGESGLAVARHEDWEVLPGQLESMLRDLLQSHRDILGRSGHHEALVLLSPMPASIPTRGGLRTAGMVREQTLIVYADRADAIPPQHPDIVEAMAVFLGHELFHLWVPSAVQVTRELSWLSEGWAMHMGRRAAVASGWVAEEGAERWLNRSYRRYLDIGGYRAGSLPAASVGNEAQRNLLYLRGELVFRLLEREWKTTRPDEPFERALWQALVGAYDGLAPLETETIRTVLSDLIDPVTVRRYVEGQAPLTPAALGLAGR